MTAPVTSMGVQMPVVRLLSDTFDTNLTHSPEFQSRIPCLFRKANRTPLGLAELLAIPVVIWLLRRVRGCDLPAAGACSKVGQSALNLAHSRMVVRYGFA
jgi:hypothetical protein